MILGDRLILRQWQEDDLAPFALLNADPDVMRYFERPLVQAESDKSAARFKAAITEHGFGFWAVELKADGSFVGMIGLEHVGADLPFGPAVEIGWRIRKDVWGQGLAPEGAKLALHYAFERLSVPEVVSFTAASNKPSQRMMEKIGMQRSAAEDFEHPRVPAGHALKRHCLYRIKRAEFNPS